MFRLAITFLTVGQDKVEYTPVDCRQIIPTGSPRVCDVDIPIHAAFHTRFLRQVLGWFQSLSWYRVFSPGDVGDISWIELCWEFVSCTGCLPPFLVDGHWVSISDNDDAVCCAVVIWYRGKCAVGLCVC